MMVVDDHELVRSGIRSMLSATDDLHLVAEAETAADAVRTAQRERPDVIVMDIRLLEGSGIEATREIRARLPQTQVLMLTSFADDEALYASIMAGGAGYVLKQIRVVSRFVRYEHWGPDRACQIWLLRAQRWSDFALGLASGKTKSWRDFHLRRRRSSRSWRMAKRTRKLAASCSSPNRR
jgi:CheY-like chemotaxis protein